MGRRWGKTTLGRALCLATAARGGKVAWIVPSYKNGRPLWREVELAIADLVKAGRVRMNRTERTIEFLDSGGFLAIYSASDNANAVRGEAFHLIVLDEAARIPEDAWTGSIQPALADYGGRAILISTPRGMNWFYAEWMRGQDRNQSEVISFTAPSSANPNPRIQRAAALAKERVPERVYREEWLAEFVADSGGIFTNVDGIIDGVIQKQPTHPHERYILGIDIAKFQDYSVMVVLHERTRKVVDFHRFNHYDYETQKKLIYLIAKHWNNAQIWLDSTGVGEPIYDALAATDLNVHAFHINTNRIKADLINNLAILIEQHKIGMPNIPVMVMELKAFQYVRSPAGNLWMQAPDGGHDDCVIALALACWPLAHFSDAPVAKWYEDAKLHREARREAIVGFGGLDLLDRRL